MTYVYRTVAWFRRNVRVFLSDNAGRMLKLVVCRSRDSAVLETYLSGSAVKQLNNKTGASHKQCISAIKTFCTIKLKTKLYSWPKYITTIRLAIHKAVLVTHSQWKWLHRLSIRTLIFRTISFGVDPFISTIIYKDVWFKPTIDVNSSTDGLCEGAVSRDLFPETV